MEIRFVFSTEIKLYIFLFYWKNKNVLVGFGLTFSVFCSPCTFVNHMQVGQYVSFLYCALGANMFTTGFFGCMQNVDGVNYFHVKVVGLFFVATTRVNVSPSLVFELLQRVARVIKDYLGILNEDSLRKNFVLVYELLDEVVVST